MRKGDGEKRGSGLGLFRGVSSWKTGSIGREEKKREGAETDPGCLPVGPISALNIRLNISGSVTLLPVSGFVILCLVIVSCRAGPVKASSW